jgi:ATP-dependent exoDNAse (exonuclease V) beta subunit
MTIHKAKGLEFEVVIVPGLGRRARTEEPKLLMWLERPSRSSEGELLVAPVKEAGTDSDPLLDYVKRIEKQKSAHEDGRLLYVAATRARRELHLLGHAGWSAEDGLRKPESTSLLSRIWTVVEPAFRARAAELEATGAAPVSEQVPDEPPAQPLRRLVAGWALPEPPPALAGSAPPEESGVSRERVSFEWVGDTLRYVGTVVHAALQRIAEDGPDAWERGRAEERSRMYESALRWLGVSEGELPDAAARVERAVAQTLADERGRWILSGAHEDSRSEYGLTGFIGGEFVSARIDRTFVDERGTRWIVDFKTSAHEGGGIRQFLANELERWRAPMEKYRALFALREARPIRIGLYFPLLGAWCEYEEAAAGV